MKCSLRGMSINQVLIKGQSRLLIEGIDQHSTMAAFILIHKFFIFFFF